MTGDVTSRQIVPKSPACPEGLFLMDGIEGLRSLPKHSVDMLLTDPPYGTTRNFWDVPLPLPELWEAVKWAVKPDGAVLFFAQCPYGPQPLLHTLQKSGRRANITTLRFLTLPRSWCGLFLLWRNPGSRTARQRKFLLIASTGVLTSSCFAIPFLNHLPFYHIHSFLGLTLNS